MPDILETSEDVDLVATAAEDDRYAELLLAGFQACAREALRFLLEEEGLSPDHPLPSGLNEHLVRQQCNLAGTIHNDSGVDLEESFLSSSLDGDTRIPEETFSVNSDTVTKDSGCLQASSHELNAGMGGGRFCSQTLDDSGSFHLRTEVHEQKKS